MGLLSKSKKRNNLKLVNLRGEMRNVDINDICEYKKNQKHKYDMYENKNAFNVDETGLYYKLVPSKTICKNVKPGFKLLKDRISLLLCTNADGSEKLDPLLIGKSKRHKCLRNFKNNVEYKSNSLVWMTSDLFNGWFSDLNGKCIKENTKIFLLMDNCPAHKIQKTFTNIEIEFFPKNATGVIQPLDMGIIKAFKSHL